MSRGHVSQHRAAVTMGSVGTEVSRQQATHRVMPICRCRARAPRWFPGRRRTTRRYPRDFTTVHKLDGFRFVSRWRDGRRCLLSEVERETLLVVFVTSKSLQYFTSYRGIPTPRIQRWRRWGGLDMLRHPPRSHHTAASHNCCGFDDYNEIYST